MLHQQGKRIASCSVEHEGHVLLPVILRFASSCFDAIISLECGNLMVVLAGSSSLSVASAWLNGL